MATQTNTLIKTLKGVLKQKAITYAQIGKALKLSEASVKRLFSSGQISLPRLDQICQLANIEITDLLRSMEQQAQRLECLTQAQEQEICADLLLMSITVCVLNRWSAEQIQQHHHITLPELIQKLAHLDRLGVLELLPNNAYRLKIAANFRWIENGPIQQFFLKHITGEFFNSRFNAEHEALQVCNGMLSAQSNHRFQAAMRRLVDEFEQMSREDARLPFEQRHGTTLLLAMRGWNYSLFPNRR